jgi:NAD(P)-dependent dehydrogenase (short-subunit alcohol dehydrogenase family)
MVASSASKMGKIEFDNLQGERVYKPVIQAYAQSKLADLIFSQELQRRLKAVGSPILSTAAHRGYALTNLQGDHMGPEWKILMAMMKPFLSQDAAHGALPTLFAAVAEKAVAGGYYGPDSIAELKGYPTAVPVPKRALDGSVAKRLWVESERLTLVKFGALSDVA